MASQVASGAHSTTAGPTFNIYITNPENGSPAQSSGAPSHHDHDGFDNDINYHTTATPRNSFRHQQPSIDTSPSGPISKLFDFLDSLGLKTSALRSLVKALAGPQSESANQHTSCADHAATDPYQTGHQASFGSDYHAADDESSGDQYFDTSASPNAPGTSGSDDLTAQHSKALLDDPAVLKNFGNGVNMDQMTEIAENKNNAYKPETVEAAKHFSRSQLAFEALDVAHQAGNKTPDGFVGRQDLETSAGDTPTRQHVKALLNDPHMMKEFGKNMTPETLRQIQKHEKATPEAKAAATYLLTNQHAFNDIDVAHQTNHDAVPGKVDSLIWEQDLKAYLEQGNAGVSEDTHGTDRKPKAAPAAVTTPAAVTAPAAVTTPADQAVPKNEQASAKGNAGKSLDNAPKSVKTTAQHAIALRDDPAVLKNFGNGVNMDQMKQIANSKPGVYNSETVEAAKHFSKSLRAFEALDVAHQAGNKTPDGFVGRQDLETSAGDTPTRQNVKALLNDPHMMKEFGKNMTPETLRQIQKHEKATPEAKAAATYLLTNQHAFNDIDVAHQTNHDAAPGKVDSLIWEQDLKAYLEQGNAGVREGTRGTERNIRLKNA